MFNKCYGKKNGIKVTINSTAYINYKLRGVEMETAFPKNLYTRFIYPTLTRDGLATIFDLSKSSLLQYLLNAVVTFNDFDHIEWQRLMRYVTKDKGYVYLGESNDGLITIKWNGFFLHFILSENYNINEVRVNKKFYKETYSIIPLDFVNQAIEDYKKFKKEKNHCTGFLDIKRKEEKWDFVGRREVGKIITKTKGEYKYGFYHHSV